jgi:hypothetical protein
LMKYFPNGLVVVKDNLNLKIVEMIFYRFGPFKSLNIGPLPAAISLVDLLSGLADPGKGARGGYRKQNEN